MAKTKKISFDTYVNEFLKLDYWYINGLPKTNNETLFHKCEPDYLYLFDVVKYHTQGRPPVYYLTSDKPGQKITVLKTHSAAAADQFIKDSKLYIKQFNALKSIY